MIEARKSIRYKLMRVIMITSAALLLLTFSFFFFYEFISYRSITERQLNTIGSILASNSTAALAFDSQEDAHEILSALTAGKNITSACIYNKDGKIFTAYPDSTAISEFPTEPGQEGFRVTENHIEGFVPIQQNGVQLGTLFIKRNLTDLYERLLVYSIVAILAMGVSFAFVFVFSRRLQKGISAPISALSETSRLVSVNRNYSIRVEKQTDDEIGFLTDAFNHMLSQIEIQNKEIEASRAAAQQHSLELEVKVNERTIEIKKQKDFAEAVVNSSLVLIAVYDLETRIIGYNHKCEEEFGLKREEVLGKKYLDVFPGVRDTLSYANLMRSLNGEIIHTPKYKSGVTGSYYESFMVPLRNENNAIYAVLMTANNITQIVESSEKIAMKNAELQSTNEALEQFAYIASHDLQEPLRKIRIFIDLLKENLGNPGIAGRYMLKVDTSAERMMLLIKDVLEYSRLSQPQENFTKVDLNEILHNVRMDFELLIAERHAVIENGSLPILYGNKLQIHQLFTNLIGNSIKFCESHPIIKISSALILDENVIKSISSDLNPSQRYVELKFSDNGIGFESHYAEKIFTIFQRLNSREKYEGTGIGLALCKRIVQNHNGYIGVNSTLGKGATFTILLPQNQLEFTRSAPS